MPKLCPVQPTLMASFALGFSLWSQGALLGSWNHPKPAASLNSPEMASHSDTSLPSCIILTGCKQLHSVAFFLSVVMIARSQAQEPVCSSPSVLQTSAKTASVIRSDINRHEGLEDHRIDCYDGRYQPSATIMTRVKTPETRDFL
ncbi:uncharacterized protein B0I36DRAFT_67024 [Microdochium trichocladiopsis]|uniref:Uncharacterized protein n=1 Tax=Microdochium trichocladiopsis TaxID=1682393 RepID=A0A9P8YE00_9PEZI|nr:uncharacterized protein B0I36DRAFT_67024 [Microdochium trichocladiopsis]KAH7037504.1 hypothetical protein B0I36DRAFT_67024 [Microdochium trichocladiopsis]